MKKEDIMSNLSKEQIERLVPNSTLQKIIKEAILDCMERLSALENDTEPELVQVAKDEYIIPDEPHRMIPDEAPEGEPTKEDPEIKADVDDMLNFLGKGE